MHHESCINPSLSEQVGYACHDLVSRRAALQKNCDRWYGGKQIDEPVHEGNDSRLLPGNLEFKQQSEEVGSSAEIVLGGGRRCLHYSMGILGFKEKRGVVDSIILVHAGRCFRI